MKYNKIVFVFMIAALLFCASGCKKNDGIKLDAKNPVKLSLWNYYHGPQQNAFDQMVVDFNNTLGLEKGIIVESYNYGGVTDLAIAVLDSAEGNVGSKPMPNIFASYSDNAYQLDLLGKLASIDDYLSEDDINLYISDYINEGYFGKDNKLKIFPIAKASEVGMLNKTDFDIFASEVGNVTYDDLTTFEGIMKVAEIYYNWTDEKTPDIANDGKAFFGIDSVANFMNIVSHQMGKDMFVISDGTASPNYTEESLRTIWDIYHNSMVKGYFIANARFRSDDAKVGDLLYLIGSTTGAAYFPTQVTDASGATHPVELMTFTMPVLASGKKAAVQQGAGMCVTKSDEKSEYASVIFLKWFTEPSRNIDFSINSSGYMPVMKAAMEGREVISKIEAQLNENKDTTRASSFYIDTLKTVETFVEQYNTYAFFSSPPFYNSDKIRTVLDSFGTITLNDCQAAKTEIETGKDYNAVIDSLCSEEAFKSWFQNFDSEIRKLLQ